MSSKKTKTTQTVTPTNPEWVTTGQQAFSNRTQDLLSQDPASFVAGPSQLQQQQFGLAGDLGGSAPSQFSQARTYADSAAQTAPVSHATAQTAYQGVGNYLNPFTEQVAGNTLNDMFSALQMTQNENGRGAVMAGQGYGGSRQGLLDSVSQKNFYGQVGNTLGNLYNTGYNTALDYSNKDADRAQQTSIFNASADNAASLAGQQAQLQAANLYNNQGQYNASYLANSGATQQGLDQAQAQAPITTLQQLSGVNSQIPYNLFNGSNTTGTSKTSDSLLGTLKQGLGLYSDAASILKFSDGRLKRDVETAGRDAEGRRWVDFRYLWDAPDAPKRRGVIAQEMRETDPEAVGRHPSGFLTVDYAKLRR